MLPTSYRQVPTFGSDTIQKFSINASELKKLAACDYKDLLQVSLDSIFISTTNKQYFHQCSTPVFEGPLPEPHNSVIMVLLFTCCNWHGLAKLRMHTDLTLGIFDTATTTIGSEFCQFTTNTCNAFHTKELLQETEARHRHALKRNANRGAGGLPTNSQEQTGPLPKKLNILTIKNHSLGDYPDQIRHYGTTDSYSTELVHLTVYLSIAAHAQILCFNIRAN